MLSVGIWLNISYDTYARILPSYHILSADNLAIIAGATTFVIAFCGCCGAWFQSKCLLTTYLVSIVLVMILEIGAGTLAFTFRRTFSETLKQELLDGIEKRYLLNDSNGMKATWDQIQTRFDCCGVNNYTDWYKISAWPEEEWVPDSCCIPFVNKTFIDDIIDSENDNNNDVDDVSQRQCGRNSDDVFRYRKHGCFLKIRGFVIKNLHIVGMSSIVAAFVQFFVIVGALLIVCTMDYKKQSRPIFNHNNRPTYNRVPTL